MDVLITYDVATESPDGQRRLRKVAKVCQNFGQRVQKSVFECSVNEAQYEELVRRLLRCIDKGEDSLRVYRLSGSRATYVEVFGIDRSVDFEGPLIV